MGRKILHLHGTSKWRCMLLFISLFFDFIQFVLDLVVGRADEIWVETSSDSHCSKDCSTVAFDLHFLHLILFYAFFSFCYFNDGSISPPLAQDHRTVCPFVLLVNLSDFKHCNSLCRSA